MPWQVGIDEAGYGPNLGPFVMTLVACQAPARANFWDALQAAVRRGDDAVDHRLVVADSKQVYSPANGWMDLEKTALSAHAGGFFERRAILTELLHDLAFDDLPSLREEAWFVGDTELPTEVGADDLSGAIDCWREAAADAGIGWGFCQCVIVPAPRFNDMIDRWDSKGIVLSLAMTQLIQRCLQRTAPEPMRFIIDKHGGRNTYSAALQHAFVDGIVWAEKEGAARSDYRVDGLDRPVRITFMPKADVEHFNVALASMISKYVRELLMIEFNRYWQTHVPGLKATAGYPGDSHRYYDEIRPAMAKLGIAERAVWRCR